MKDLGTVVLAGHNEGSGNLLKEYIEKQAFSFIYSLFSDSFIFGVNKGLLTPAAGTERYSAKDASSLLWSQISTIRKGSIETGSIDSQPKVINFVEKALQGSSSLESNHIVCVGPKEPLEKVVDKSTWVVSQGSDIAENARRGADFLYNYLGYDKDYFLICCGDLSAINSATIDTFIGGIEKRHKEGTSIYAGVSTWESLKSLIIDNDLERYGRMGSRFFPFIPGRINKFGITLIDDDELVDQNKGKYRFSWANMFLVHKSIAQRTDVASFIYSNKRALLSPGMVKSIISTTSLSDVYDLLTHKLPATVAEDVVSKVMVRALDLPDFRCKIAYAPPEALLDIDTWKDHYRNSALIERRHAMKDQY
jgi:hypothetical protein